MDGKPLRSWRNKRKKSLYSEEAEAGFIFKKLPRVDECEVSPAKQQTLQQKAAGLPLAGVIKQALNESAASNESLDVFEHEEDLGNEDIHKAIELKRFIAQVKKELLAAGSDSSESELDCALGLLATDLRELYFEYLEATDDGDSEDSPQHLMEEELRDHIAQMKANIEMYKREVAEWEQVIKTKKSEAEQTVRDMEEERSIDFLNLRSEDADVLTTYLTPEQTQHLQQGSEVNLDFTDECSKQLEGIMCRAIQEKDRIQDYCENVARQISAESVGLEHNATAETPRTLFRALARPTDTSHASLKELLCKPLSHDI